MKYAAFVLIVLVTAGGWAVYALFVALSNSRSLEDVVATGSIVGTIIGSVLGTCYWWALGQWHLRTGYWVAATILGWAVGGALGGAISSAIYNAIYVAPLSNDIYGAGLGAIGLTVGAATGAVVSTCQWLVMLSRMPRAWPWVAITTAGWAMAGFVAWLVGLSVGATIASVTGWAGWAVFLPVGLVTGVAAGSVIVAVATVIALKLMLEGALPRRGQT